MGQPHNCLLACCQVCSARVDVRSGSLYWLACNRRDIGVTQAPNMTSHVLHRARSSIQHLFLDWQRGALYWLAPGQPLQRLSLAGGDPQDAWNETWPGELPVAMDSRAFTLLWSSALGESWRNLEQRGVAVEAGATSDALHAAGPCLGGEMLLGQALSHGWAPVLSHEVPPITGGCGGTGWAWQTPCPKHPLCLQA